MIGVGGSEPDADGLLGPPDDDGARSDDMGVPGASSWGVAGTNFMSSLSRLRALAVAFKFDEASAHSSTMAGCFRRCAAPAAIAAMSSATRTVRGLRAPSSSSFFVLRLRAIVFFASYGAAWRSAATAWPSMGSKRYYTYTPVTPPYRVRYHGTCCAFEMRYHP